MVDEQHLESAAEVRAYLQEPKGPVGFPASVVEGQQRDLVWRVGLARNVIEQSPVE